jgi:hypothetical protein
LLRGLIINRIDAAKYFLLY